MGLREVKKERTRDALAEAAVRLFQEKGYAQTTVAEIAAAAGMSTRTFFLHFPAKEDVLLAGGRPRLDLGLAVIADRRPGESIAELLTRALDAMVSDVWEKDLHSGLAAMRAQLAATEPELQARLVHRLHATQSELADALLRACPGELSPSTAATVVGAVLGAVHAAADASLRQGDPPARVRAAMLAAPGVAADLLRGTTKYVDPAHPTWGGTRHGHASE
ncbi:TetR/AcrR family transcriptional regulator [Streptosporangium sp. KLBMP 9127]|nr:TetR/AcrR family transcriptional regulator [Streptosporangium sp. KLBMP 9127]